MCRIVYVVSSFLLFGIHEKLYYLCVLRIMGAMRRNWTNDMLIDAVKTSGSIREVIKKLGMIPAGGNYSTVHKMIQELHLDISHFHGQGWNQGLKFVPKKAQPLGEILVEHSNYKSIWKLKNRLIKEGLKETRCECCGLTEWNGYPIPLELHHLNGISSDLRIENLQILCPNCHALTENYRGKKLKR